MSGLAAAGLAAAALATHLAVGQAVLYLRFRSAPRRRVLQRSLVFWLLAVLILLPVLRLGGWLFQ